MTARQGLSPVAQHVRYTSLQSSKYHESVELFVQTREHPDIVSLKSPLVSGLRLHLDRDVVVEFDLHPLTLL